MLDGSLADPSAHRTLLRRLRAAGLAPVYRRFDPRLAEADVERYPVVVWLAGRVRGSAGSLAVTPEEVERAARLVERGGRLVLGVEPGRPGAEGRAFQAVLDRLGVPIRIGPHEVVDLDPDSSYPASLLRVPLFAPGEAVAGPWGLPGRLVGGRSAPLEVGEGARVLLRTLPTAFLDALYGPAPADPAARRAFAVAADAPAGRRGGRVLVASRALLGAGGALAHADVEPLLPDRLPAGALAGRERLLAAALADLVAGVARPRPEAAAPVVLPESTAAARAGVCRVRPGEAWLDDEGVRAGWGYVDRPEGEMERLLAALPASGLNVLWGPAARWWGLLVEPDRDPARAGGARRGVMRVAGALAGTPVRWLVGVNVPGDADLARYPKAVSLGGVEVDVPSPVDAAFWEEVVLPRLRAAVEAAGAGRPVAGVVLDLEMYGRPVLYWRDAFDFGDGPFRAFLDATGEEGAGHAATLSLPAAERADWLLARGRLDDYFAFLERRAEAIGRRLRQSLDAAAGSRDLVLGFYAVGILPHWFYRGLFRGASDGGRPVLLFTFRTEARAEIAAAAREGTCLYHAQAALLGLVGRDGLAPALARAARVHDGFWLNRVTHLAASYAVAPHDAVEVPPLRGEAGWAWVREAVEAYARARASR
ncbi:MAG TPA: hypothetical protein VIM86_00070 [Thermodesulfobacteriota bacterium]